MKTIYPLVALLSAALVAAGPSPRTDNLDARSNDLIHARTEPAPAPAAEPMPAPSAADAEAEKQRLADEEAKKAADAMEAMHVAKAEAEAKAHQEGMYWTRLSMNND
jgi:flagellar biosynthesis/type III secretory pathway protein FliH